MEDHTRAPLDDSEMHARYLKLIIGVFAFGLIAAIAVAQSAPA